MSLGIARQFFSYVSSLDHGGWICSVLYPQLAVHPVWMSKDGLTCVSYSCLVFGLSSGNSEHLLGKPRFVYITSQKFQHHQEEKSQCSSRYQASVKVPLTKSRHMVNPDWSIWEMTLTLRGLNIYIANFVICYTFKIPSEVGPILLSTPVTS